MSADILNFIINGSIIGLTYALLALGFSLVYGVGGVLNLSHGAFYMITGYFIYWSLPYFVGFEWLSVVLALIVVTIIGALTYLFLINPLEDTATGVVLITFGVAFFVEQFIKFIWGSSPFSLHQLVVWEGSTEIASGVSINNQHLLLIIVSIIVITIFALFINKTRIGNSIRAVSQDREAATLMGINANRILMYTVMIAAFLVGIAAILYLPTAPLSPNEGWGILTNSFAVVILGGMGSLGGSVVGAFILGYANAYTNAFIPNGAAWSHIVPIILIVIMLIVRPQGIFGKKEVD